MTAEKLDARTLDDAGITWTLLGTLYLRAYESRAEQPILGDTYAAEAVDRIDYDFARLSRKLNPKSNQWLVALRAKQLDMWSADFLSRHPDATVLQLGCGLDSRMLRLAPPPTAQWFDLDIPKVIDIRRRLYPAHDHYEMIGASVTDDGWLGKVPADRPALVIAEGLFPYLHEKDVRQLLQRLTGHFGSGELIFDAMAPWVSRVISYFHWGLRDGRLLESWNPRLRLVEQATFDKYYEKIPDRGVRRIYRIGSAIPFWRHIYHNFHYRF